MNFFYRLLIVSLLIFALPLMIIIGLCIVIGDGFPVFFLQRRVGKLGNHFTLFKFRTMVQNAEDQKGSLLKKNEAHGPVFKMRNDPRFTAFGKFLNHTGFDELPQLFNVLFGTMALIGPRPLPVTEASKLKNWHHEREKILPGIISPWILEGYHQTTLMLWTKRIH